MPRIGSNMCRVLKFSWIYCRIEFIRIHIRVNYGQEKSEKRQNSYSRLFSMHWQVFYISVSLFFPFELIHSRHFTRPYRRIGKKISMAAKCVRFSAHFWYSTARYITIFFSLFHDSSYWIFTLNGISTIDCHRIIDENVIAAVQCINNSAHFNNVRDN